MSSGLFVGLKLHTVGAFKGEKLQKLFTKVLFQCEGLFETVFRPLCNN